MMILFLGIGLTALFAVRFLQKKPSSTKPEAVRAMLPHAVSMLIVTAQISELVKVVEHVTVVNMTAALLLLTVMVATKTGTEGELH